MTIPPFNEVGYMTAIENEDRYRFTLAKIEELEQRLAALDIPHPSLHPRQVIGRRNSFKLTLGQLKREIAEYERQPLARSILNQSLTLKSIYKYDYENR